MAKLSVKQLACAVALSSACAGANAVSYDLGLIEIGAPKQFNAFVPAQSVFGDVISFTLPANGGSGYSVLNFPLTIPGGVGDFNLLFSSMVLVSDPDGIPLNNPLDEVILQTVTGGAGTESLSLTFGPTGPASMFLVVQGASNGSLGGIYTGAISVSPVPESEAWAMMLVGFGLVGFQLHRKSKQTAVNRFV